MSVPLTLKVFKGEAMVAAKDYDRDIIKIGRLASAHLCLDDDKVSRIHSVIEVAPDGKLSIIDMGSVEGTWVNGKRVNKGALVLRRRDPGRQHADQGRGRCSRQRCRGARATAQVAAPVAPRRCTPTATRLSPSAALAEAARAVPLTHAAPAVARSAPVPLLRPAPAPVAPAPGRRARSGGRPRSGGSPRAGCRGDWPHLDARLRPVRRKGAGPLGLELRFRWGDQIVAEQLLGPKHKGEFKIGSAAGVDFAVGDQRLGGRPFALVSADGTGRLHPPHHRADDRRARAQGPHRQPDAGHRVRARHRGTDDAYAIALEPDDIALVDVGGVVVDLCFQPVPQKVAVPLSERLDWTALNIFLLVFFFAGLLVVAAVTRAASGDEFTDELSANNAVLTKLLVKPPEMQKNPFIEQLNKQKEKGEAPAAFQGTEGQMGKKNAPKRDAKAAPKAIDPNSKDQARLIAQRIFGGKGERGHRHPLRPGGSGRQPAGGDGPHDRLHRR